MSGTADGATPVLHKPLAKAVGVEAVLAARRHHDELVVCSDVSARRSCDKVAGPRTFVIGQADRAALFLLDALASKCAALRIDCEVERSR